MGKADWSSWERGIGKEWLLTNGIGGFAASTITGGNSRRYHGLLVAALEPPVRRHLILSQLHETVISGGREYNLHSFSTGSFIMKGFHQLLSFELDPLPVFTYSMGDIFIEKTVTMIYGENTTAVVYRIRSGSEHLMMKVTPLVNFRDYHSDSKKQYMSFIQSPFSDGTLIRPYGADPQITLNCGGSAYIPAEDCWFENMYYAVENERGLQANEDHYIPGSFELSVEAHTERIFTFIATVEKDCRHTDGCALIAAEKERQAALEAGAGYKDEFASALVRAADNFIAYRKSTDAKTILAGYPWFTDWGRDAMIAFCGLTLCTGRYDDAAQILGTFSEYINYGLIPNMFPDEGGDPGYNTVDAALWYIEAVNKYIQYTGDTKLVENKLFPSMLQICGAYQKGTLHNIHMDSDGLIIAGDENTQLTWMDAKIGETAFTPRHGKAVEINALWYNAIRVMEMLAGSFGMDTDPWSSLASRIKVNFRKTFWNEDGKYLYDVVSGKFRDDSVRPNQIFAVSLSWPVLEGLEARCVVEKVWRELYTAYGLRSLSPASPQYKGHCTGDRYSRDSAYHQGTVWAWLSGHFITAFAATLGKEPQYSGMISAFLQPFSDHLQNACVGSISEIFDGDEPLIPRGSFAQAWSVAEVLRAYTEHGLNRKL